jgi:hypothetical protein
MLAALKNFFVLLILITSSSASLAQDNGFRIAENEAGTHYMFSILGYNYTDEHISAFSIDGQGGGSIRVSTPDSGGSGIVCCILFSKKPKWPIHVLVRWQSGGCKVYARNGKYSHRQFYYKEKMVNVEPGTSAHPSDIAVHFYKDGSVRVRLVDELEPPLLALPKNREVERDFPDCKLGEPVEYL